MSRITRNNQDVIFQLPTLRAPNYQRDATHPCNPFDNNHKDSSWVQQCDYMQLTVPTQEQTRGEKYGRHRTHWPLRTKEASWMSWYTSCKWITVSVVHFLFYIMVWEYVIDGSQRKCRLRGTCNEDLFVSSRPCSITDKHQANWWQESYVTYFRII